MKKTLNKDSIIVLAWPQTPAKAIGRWYDKLTEVLGFLKNDYYKAGHAAAVLVDHQNEKLHYFDFGRYHMPRKIGRVRSSETDPGLTIRTKPVISADGEITNIDDIITELNNNQKCHGTGTLYASVLKNVCFLYAFQFAQKMQNQNSVKYGPYVIKGTNCSRFVASLLKASKPQTGIKLKLSASVLFTPLTKSNVYAVNSKYIKLADSLIEHKEVKFMDMMKNYMIPFTFRTESDKHKKQIQNIGKQEKLNYDLEYQHAPLNF